MADRYGMRRLMVIGAASAVASLLSFGLAPSWLTLLVTAVLGGLTNATLPALSLAIARNTLAGAARSRALGWATAGGAGAGIVGYRSWRSQATSLAGASHSSPPAPLRRAWWAS